LLNITPLPRCVECAPAAPRAAIISRIKTTLLLQPDTDVLENVCTENQKLRNETTK
jgi:hypothetical protein